MYNKDIFIGNKDNNNNCKKVTLSQIRYIYDIVKRLNNYRLSFDVYSLSSEQASKLIKQLLNSDSSELVKDKVLIPINQIDIHYNNAKILFDLNRLYEAIVELTESIRINPNNPDAYRFRGIVNNCLEKYYSAEKDLITALNLNTMDSQTYYRLGVLYTYYLHEEYKAATYIERAIELEPKFIEAILCKADALSDKTERIKCYSKVIEIDYSCDKAYYYRGFEYHHSDLEGNYKKALDDFNKAIQLNPYEARYFYDRGNLYSELGKSEIAVNDYNQAVKLEPANTLYLISRGHTYKNIGQLHKAEEDYRLALLIEPDNKRIKGYLKAII